MNALALIMAAAVSVQPAPQAAPNITFNQNEDVCRTASSLGIANFAVSLSANVGMLDPNCIRIKDARILNQLGYGAAAIQLMCMDNNIAASMKKAGTPCERQYKGSPNAY